MPTSPDTPLKNTFIDRKGYCVVQVTPDHRVLKLAQDHAAEIKPWTELESTIEQMDEELRRNVLRLNLLLEEGMFFFLFYCNK